MLDGRWRSGFDKGLQPVGAGLAKAGVTADALTVVGLGCSIATALLIASGHLHWAVLGVILTGVPDLLDGSVARHSGKAGPRGAFFDSVCDRVSDVVLIGGVAWYFGRDSSRLPVLALAVAGISMLISYERAKAEALGFQAKGGLLERAERLVLLGIGLAFNILVPVMWLMVVLGTITAVQRFVKVWRQASAPAGHDPVTRRFGASRRARHTDLDPVDGRPRSLSEWWETARPAALAERRELRRSRRRTRP
jgi:CDP-diacylglycerol--glycerol-3-phosphate 3-phosphatidyltransferase